MHNIGSRGGRGGEGRGEKILWLRIKELKDRRGGRIWITDWGRRNDIGRGRRNLSLPMFLFPFINYYLFY